MFATGGIGIGIGIGGIAGIGVIFGLAVPGNALIAGAVALGMATLADEIRKMRMKIEGPPRGEARAAPAVVVRASVVRRRPGPRRRRRRRAA
jgi:hypothetical protein